MHYPNCIDYRICVGVIFVSKHETSILVTIVFHSSGHEGGSHVSTCSKYAEFDLFICTAQPPESGSACPLVPRALKPPRVRLSRSTLTTHQFHTIFISVSSQGGVVALGKAHTCSTSLFFSVLKIYCGNTRRITSSLTSFFAVLMAKLDK